MTSNRQPEVIYILGAGRSGSTVLGILLGNLSTAFYGGELFAWPHFRGVPITEKPEVEAFWADFAATMPADPIHSTDDYYVCLERWSALLRRRWWTDRKLRRDYEAHTTAFFSALRTKTGAASIVDSSHFPLRAGALRRHGHSLGLVHLSRDPRDVIRALGREEQRRSALAPIPAAAYCWMTAIMSRYQMWRARGVPKITIRYEDLVNEPHATTQQMCDALGMPYEELDPEHLIIGPVFNGNRLRHDDAISLRPPGPRADAVGSGRIADAFVWPLRRMYGHR